LIDRPKRYKAGPADAGINSRLMPALCGLFTGDDVAMNNMRQHTTTII